MEADRKSIHMLVLDMDNTLYDWVDYFVPAVRGMLDRAAKLLDADRENLTRELRDVHVRYGNTEQPFALLETKSVLDRMPDASLKERYDYLTPAFAAFDEVRTERLQLYPGVRETLGIIRQSGCRVFGYTEATNVNINVRARMLGLQGLIEALYAPEFAGSPHPLGSGRSRSGDAIPLVSLPARMRKPNPEVVLAILQEVNVAPEKSLYIGDSLAKDVVMAIRAGMCSAWARYGTIHDAVIWGELLALSHWDGSTASRPGADTPVRSQVEPDVVLDSFDEVLGHFSFGNLG